MILPDQDPLICSLIRPETMAGLSLRDWDELLPRARAALLLPRLAVLAERGGLVERLPEPVRRHLANGAALARAQQRKARWELHRLEQELLPLGDRVLLLKGAAYVAAALPVADGRIFDDIDIMVPFEALDRVEDTLIRAGWEYEENDEYDRRYYLKWMHELPPLRHRRRQSVLDVHHTILPRTSRLKPDPALLWAAARLLPASPFLVLSPADMLLHSAAHLFQDGDLHLRLRDLIDLQQMAECFGNDAEFWPHLLQRAEALQLARPLYYAMRFCTRLLALQLPAEFLAGLDRAGPSGVSRTIMDRTVPATLIPPGGQSGAGRQAAVTFLYIRSHWLRMPPLLLAAHLLRKSFRRARAARQANLRTG